MFFPENENFISTWLMPKLKFFKVGLEIDALDSALKGEIETQLQKCCEDKHNLAFVLLNKGAAFQPYVGVSQNQLADSDASFDSDLIQLTSVDPDLIKKRIREKSAYVSLIENASGVISEQRPHGILPTKLLTLSAGIVVLAIPIPMDYVRREIKAMEDQLLKARTSTKSNEKILAYIRKTEQSLMRLTNGMASGLWQTAVYFFTSTSLGAQACAKLFNESDETITSSVDRHLVTQFAVPKTKLFWSNVEDSLFGYKYLRPTSSRELTSLVTFDAYARD